MSAAGRPEGRGPRSGQARRPRRGSSTGRWPTLFCFTDRLGLEPDDAIAAVVTIATTRTRAAVTAEQAGS